MGSCPKCGRSRLRRKRGARFKVCPRCGPFGAPFPARRGADDAVPSMPLAHQGRCQVSSALLISLPIACAIVMQIKRVGTNARAAWLRGNRALAGVRLDHKGD